MPKREWRMDPAAGKGARQQGEWPKRAPTGKPGGGARGEIPKKCPACGSERVAPIVYGHPGPQLVEEADAGRVVMGGCVVWVGAPWWQCLACNATESSGETTGEE